MSDRTTVVAQPSERHGARGIGHGAADLAEDLSNSETLDVLARFGFAVTGLVHVLIGIIAIRLPFGGRGEADPSGAVALLAIQPFGPLLLWISAIGCFALSLWQLSEATIRARHLPTRKRISKGISSGWLSIAYGALALTIVHFALGVGQGSRASARGTTAGLLELPIGEPLLLAAGLFVTGIGVYFVIKGASKKFKQELHFPNSRRGHVMSGLGVVGHISKGVALVLAGALILIATWQRDPRQSTGLDGSLRALIDHPFGGYLLVAIAMGLICYGVFAMVRAKYGRM